MKAEKRSPSFINQYRCDLEDVWSFSFDQKCAVIYPCDQVTQRYGSNFSDINVLNDMLVTTNTFHDLV